MTTCDNCREVTELKDVQVGSFTENWCSFCVEQGAVPCSVCEVLLDKDTSYAFTHDTTTEYFCVTHLYQPFKGGDLMFDKTAEEWTGWLDKYIPSYLHNTEQLYSAEVKKGDELIRWIAELGYPFDFTTEIPIPEAWRTRLLDALYPEASDVTTRRDLAISMATEGGWEWGNDD